MQLVSRLRWFVVTVILVTALLVGVSVFGGARRVVAQERQQSVAARVGVEAERLAAAIQQVELDAGLIAGLPLSPPLGPEVTSQSLTPAQLERTFVELLVTRPEYTQVRYLDSLGKERVRVDRSKKGVVVVAPGALQDKGHREYFETARDLPHRASWVHSPTLNREHGKLEIPHRPMLRVTRTKRAADGALDGVVVINVNFTALLRRIFGTSTDECCHFMMNQQGDYLVHPKLEKTYGFDLGKRYRAGDDVPGYQQWNRGRVDGPLRVTGDPFFAEFRRVALDDRRFLVVGYRAPPQDPWNGMVRVALPALLVVLALASVGLIASYWAARRIVRSLARITRAAEQLAGGGTPRNLPVHQQDEVGVMARAFAHMAQSLQAKEEGLHLANQQLRQALGDLENFAQIASHDLREPARRIANHADFLLEDEGPRLSDDARETAGRLKISALRLLEQVTDLRTFTDAGQGRLLRQTVDVDYLLQGLIDEYAEELKMRGVVVSREPHPSLVAYESLLRACYAQLIRLMSEHATGPDARVTFSCQQMLASELPSAGVEAWEAAEGASRTQVVLAVSCRPRPPGLDFPQRTPLPFSDLEDSLRRTGMGLSICRRVIERHSGRLWFLVDQDALSVLFTLGTDDVQ